jgi:ATP-dependent HslUV protease ATP-binding subunit HslU
LTEQYIALLNTEGLKISFTDNGIKRIAEMAWEVNERTENIGARRLHTMMECLLEDLSFEAPDLNGVEIVIDEGYVNQHLSDLVGNEDLSQYIL